MKFTKQISRTIRITLVAVLFATCTVLGIVPVTPSGKEEYAVEIKIPDPRNDEETNDEPEITE